MEGDQDDDDDDDDDDDKETFKHIALGRSGEKFTFKKGTLCPIKFIITSLKNDNNIKQIKQYIKNIMIDE